MSSRLIALYKAVQEFNDFDDAKTGLEFTFPEKQFNILLEEARALGPFFGEVKEDVKHIEFNTPGGKLRINKL